MSYDSFQRKLTWLLIFDIDAEGSRVVIKSYKVWDLQYLRQ